MPLLYVCSKPKPSKNEFLLAILRQRGQDIDFEYRLSNDKRNKQFAIPELPEIDKTYNTDEVMPWLFEYILPSEPDSIYVNSIARRNGMSGYNVWDWLREFEPADNTHDFAIFIHETLDDDIERYDTHLPPIDEFGNSKQSTYGDDDFDDGYDFDAFIKANRERNLAEELGNPLFRDSLSGEDVSQIDDWEQWDIEESEEKLEHPVDTDETSDDVNSDDNNGDDDDDEFTFGNVDDNDTTTAEQQNDSFSNDYDDNEDYDDNDDYDDDDDDTYSNPYDSEYDNDDFYGVNTPTAYYGDDDENDDTDNNSDDIFEPKDDPVIIPETNETSTSLSILDIPKQKVAPKPKTSRPSIRPRGIIIGKPDKNQAKTTTIAELEARLAARKQKGKK